MGTGSWSPGRVEFSARDRDRILRRDKICKMCGSRPSTQADHVVPIAEGGGNTVANGQGLCSECHGVKTRAEIERGKARAGPRPSRRRPAEQHPGLIDRGGGVG